jgi:hypothetical protein
MNYRVITTSGNEYTLIEDIQQWGAGSIWRWTAKEPRGRELEETLPFRPEGVVVKGPDFGKPMILAWSHPERGLQLRITTPIKEVWIQWNAQERWLKVVP